MTDRFNPNEEVEFNTRAFKRGETARRTNNPLKSNPFLPGTWKEKSWDAGWADADMIILSKRDEEDERS